MILAEDVMAKCDDLGVRFITHREAAVRKISNLAAWAPLFGYRNYRETVMVTMRPHIIHPDSWDKTDLRKKWKHVAHELAHWERQPTTRAGLIGWVMKYGASNKFCAIEEMHAHLVDLQTGRYPMDIPWLVEHMRDWYQLDAWYRVGRADPEWMNRWFEERVTAAGVDPHQGTWRSV